MTNPSNITIIQRDITAATAMADDQGEYNNLVKIVTGRRNCAIVRMESIAASYIVASLEKDKQYHEFVKLSPYRVDGAEITRLLFLDADYVRRHERHFRAYDPRVEVVYERGVVTLIGDLMWRMPKIASVASSTVGEHDINILNLDAQEETSRILIIVQDKGTDVGDAVKAIHAKRTKVNSSNIT
jgi:aspartate kinase